MNLQRKSMFFAVVSVTLLFVSNVAAQDETDDNPDDFDVPKPSKSKPPAVMQANPPAKEMPVVSTAAAAKKESATEELPTPKNAPVTTEGEVSILDRIVNKAISIAPSATRKNKINAFTVRLRSSIDSSSDPDSGVSSVRTRVVTQTTTTYYTATDDPRLVGNDMLGGVMGMTPIVKNTDRVVATQSTYTTQRPDFPVTVTIITYEPTVGTGSWTQTVEQTEFKWTKTLR